MKSIQTKDLKVSKYFSGFNFFVIEQVVLISIPKMKTKK